MHIGRPAALLICVILSPLPSAQAQVRPPDAAREFFERFGGRSFTNPQEMFERMLGGNDEDQQAALDAIEVTREEEDRYGNQAAEAYLDYLRGRDIRLIERGRDVAYLRALVETIKPHMQHADRYERIRIVIAKSDETDARSFPGGTLVFFEGMLDFAGNEAALAGVVGHELSHLDRGHQLLPIKRTKLAREAFSGRVDGRSFARMMRTGTALVDLWSRPFRPEDEVQADLDGARWAYEAGYDSREMAQVFLRLQERSNEPAAQFVPAFLRSHPYHKDRYETVLQQFDELQHDNPQPNLYVGTENLRRRTPRSTQEFAE